jgi:hypothetical protein
MTRPINPRKHDEIAESLTQDILVGQYRTGGRLPSERDLAPRFDAALAARNVTAVRSTFESLSNFNREVARCAFAAIRALSRGGATACAFSTGSAPSGSTPGRQPGTEENSA